jgi:hypothetical protein
VPRPATGRFRNRAGLKLGHRTGRASVHGQTAAKRGPLGRLPGRDRQPGSKRPGPSRDARSREVEVRAIDQAMPSRRRGHHDGVKLWPGLTDAKHPGRRARRRSQPLDGPRATNGRWGRDRLAHFDRSVHDDQGQGNERQISTSQLHGPFVPARSASPGRACNQDVHHKPVPPNGLGCHAPWIRRERRSPDERFVVTRFVW